MGIVNTGAVRTRMYIGTSNVNTGNLCGLEPGETYTWSFDAQWKLLSGTTETTTRYVAAYVYDNSYGSITATQTVVLGTITPELRGTEISARCEFTFTVRSAATVLYLALQCTSTTAAHYSAGDYIEMAWTPAPEDVERITAIDDVIADWCCQNDTTYINGGKIYTGSISAEKISVTDLHAFGATIGGIVINDNSITPSNGNFSVTSGGVLTATGATINGSITSVSGDYKTVLSGGGLNIYYNETWYGRFSGRRWADDNTKRGVTMDARTVTNYIFFGKYDEDLDLYASAYLINYDLNPNGYGVKINDKSGTAQSVLWMNTSNQICLHNANCVFYLGNASTKTYLRGLSINAPKLVQTGSLSVTPTAANTPTAATVTFSTAFAGTPKVTAIPLTAVPGTVVTGVGIGSVSSTGFTVYVTRTNTTATTIHWIAICQ